MNNQAQPMAGYDPRVIMDAQTEQERTAIMRSMGVANLDPPLPHSPCLKVVKTGVVHPWNELLAQQRDLVVCCDEKGNTDPKVWEPKVKHDTTTSEMLALLAQQNLFKHDNAFERPMTQARQVIGPTDYDRKDVVSYADIEKLQEKLNACKSTDTGSVEGSERSGSGE